MKHENAFEFFSFSQTDIAQVIEIFPCVRQEHTYFTWSISPGDARSHDISKHEVTILNLMNLVPAQ